MQKERLLVPLFASKFTKLNNEFKDYKNYVSGSVFAKMSMNVYFDCTTRNGDDFAKE